MDTNRIRYFLSLAKVGSITKAAEIHLISAAAFSKAMRVFEQEVGQPLTLPQGRGLILTDYARALVPSLESIIHQIDAIRGGRLAQSKSRQLLRLATFEVFLTHFMAKAIKDYFQGYHCEIHEMIPGKMEEAVACGRCDLALTYLPIPHPELDFLKIHEIEMGLFGSPKLLKEGRYESAPFAIPVSPIEGSPTKVRGLDGWPDEAFPRNAAYQVEMLETALGLCRDGIALAYVPKFVARLYNENLRAAAQLAELPLPAKFPKTKLHAYLVKRKSDHEGVEAKRLALAVRKICVSLF